MKTTTAIFFAFFALVTANFIKNSNWNNAGSVISEVTLFHPAITETGPDSSITRLIKAHPDTGVRELEKVLEWAQALNTEFGTNAPLEVLKTESRLKVRVMPVERSFVSVEIFTTKGRIVVTSCNLHAVDASGPYTGLTTQLVLTGEPGKEKIAGCHFTPDEKGLRQVEARLACESLAADARIVEQFVTWVARQKRDGTISPQPQPKTAYASP